MYRIFGIQRLIVNNYDTLVTYIQYLTALLVPLQFQFLEANEWQIIRYLKVCRVLAPSFRLGAAPLSDTPRNDSLLRRRVSRLQDAVCPAGKQLLAIEEVR